MDFSGLKRQKLKSENSGFNKGSLVHLKALSPTDEGEVFSIPAGPNASFGCATFPMEMVNFWYVKGPDRPIMYLGYHQITKMPHEEKYAHYFLFEKEVGVVTLVRNENAILTNAFNREEEPFEIDWLCWKPTDITPWFEPCEVER